MTVRTLSCPIPDSLNPLSPVGYMFSIAKLPELTYFCQEVNLPSVNIINIDQANPFVRIPQPGDVLNYDYLRVQFLIDNKMKNYKAIFDWLYGLGFPESNEDYTGFVSNEVAGGVVPSAYPNLFSDATLTILDNNNNPIQTAIFTDCFPITLDSITFNSTNSDIQYLVGNATFSYTLYKFV